MKFNVKTSVLQHLHFYTVDSDMQLKNIHGMHYCVSSVKRLGESATILCCMYEGWNFNSGNYLFTTDTK